MSDAIVAMRQAFARERQIPQRQLLGSSMFMPGRVGKTSGIKVVSTTPGNPVGIVVVFDQEGSPLGLVDGPTLTAIRTGAVAGLATDLLAPPDASTLAMLGAGAMAPDQIAAVREVRPIDTVVVWSRDITKAEHLADSVGGVATDDVALAVGDAAVITTATPATDPLFEDSMLPQTVHINAVGSYTPSMVEIPSEFVRSAFVVVDDYVAAAAEAGDLLQADRRPDIDLTDLLESGVPNHGDRTFFKSVGIASQDIAAAAQALSTATRLGLGVSL
ncbi:MAG: ornithine cyclodeaminase family protein [Actinomycetia bacterium]|nr:ornithine cyclodeaminase family protein [Actinomycetes bacterium]